MPREVDEIARDAPKCLTKALRRAGPAYIWRVKPVYSQDEDQNEGLQLTHRLTGLVINTPAPASEVFLFVHFNSSWETPVYGFTSVTCENWVRVRLYSGYTRSSFSVYLHKEDFIEARLAQNGETIDSIPAIFKISRRRATLG